MATEVTLVSALTEEEFAELYVQLTQEEDINTEFSLFSDNGMITPLFEQTIETDDEDLDPISIWFDCDDVFINPIEKHVDVACDAKSCCDSEDFSETAFQEEFGDLFGDILTEKFRSN